MDFKFQINLRGLIDLLSHHLYSGPQVFLRELLQNGVDALQARRYLEPRHQGEIHIEVIDGQPPRKPTLAFMDNGIGLTEEEVHRFLATIGQTSKRAEDWERPVDFLGQFGIGILSCFLVSEEIVVLTRTARGQGPTLEWRGRPDGTYAIKTLQGDIPPGTQVYLTAREEYRDYFQPERLADLALHFGSLLPYPIRLTQGQDARLLNDEPVPWRQPFPSSAAQTQALLDFGRTTFETDFFAAIPLQTQAGEIDGVAFVLPYSPSLASKHTHRVYLKNMLLSEHADNLVPEWAFFVKCVVNANSLRPTASREGFYEDDALHSARHQVGLALRDWLVNLAKQDPQRLQRLIALHYLSIKALAVQDDDFYRLFIDWLPFETSLGEMTLGEYRRQNNTVRWVPHLDQFRQIARVAAAQSLCVINGAYTYNSQLLEKFADVFPEVPVEMVDPAGLTQSFEDLSLAEQERVQGLLQAAEAVLEPFRCSPDIKKFRPQELPALYSTNAEAHFLRSMEQSRDVASPLWSSLLDKFSRPGDQPIAQLCFNFTNPLIRKVATLKQQQLLPRVIQMLYIQALLLGHYPLNSREMKLLNEGLLGLIEWGVDSQERGGRE